MKTIDSADESMSLVLRSSMSAVTFLVGGGNFTMNEKCKNISVSV
jgi:hypothetical protein